MRRVTLVFTPEEQAELDHLRRTATDPDVRTRAQALLHLANSQGYRGAARASAVNESAVRKWYAAYRERGLAGLQTKPRSGRPPKLTATDKVRLRAAAEKDPRTLGYDASMWSARLLNQHLQSGSDTRVSDWTVWSHMRDRKRRPVDDEPRGSEATSPSENTSSTLPPVTIPSAPSSSMLKEDPIMMSRRSMWEPMRDLLSLRQAMDNLFEESLGQGRQGYRAQAGTLFLPIDVYTTENEVVITASLPGLTGDDVDIVLQGDSVTIRGEIKPPEGNVQWAFQERPYGKFSRTLTLNIPLDMNKAEATFENGVLTLTLPKAESAKPRQIQVKTRQGQSGGQPQITNQ